MSLKLDGPRLRAFLLPCAGLGGKLSVVLDDAERLEGKQEFDVEREALELLFGLGAPLQKVAAIHFAIEERIDAGAVEEHDRAGGRLGALRGADAFDLFQRERRAALALP